MTVEQSPLPVRTTQRTSYDHLTLAKIKEVTGAPDNVIEEAIRACLRTDGTLKIEDVVTTIIGDDIARGGIKSKTHTRQTNIKSLDNVDALPSSITEGPKKQMVSGKLTSAPDEYIDLTRDAQGILGGQISREEQDISRVLEASIAESKGSTKRKRGELWFIDPLNPHERKRQDGWPVGLKNVGNTCWFSAVIQSLFHIRKFRDIVLHYKHGPTADTEISHNLRFVMELRQLFALMVGSHRKYVDPSKSVDILKEASSSTMLDGQQDVSEFQHKLLDWLEDAFRDPSSPSEENPVHCLFQGKYLAEGIHEGKVFSQKVTFGQYPLNVVGFRDIYESLEATTAQGEIENINGDSSQKSGQEIWFTHLPIVLTFELSRFGFNQQLNRAEKIHQELTFPPIIYIDRYLECNKMATKQKREEAKKLKDELASLQLRLDRFLNYGSSHKRYPLPDVLQYALEFAESSPSQISGILPQSVDVEMESPVPYSCSSDTPSQLDNTSAEQISSHMTPSLNIVQKERSVQTKTTSSSLSSSPVPEAKKFKDSSVQVEFDATLMPISVVLPPSSTQCCNTPVSKLMPSFPSTSQTHVSGCSGDYHGSCSQLDPHPKSVSTDELRVLHNCLKRWREEVEMDVRELQKTISGLEAKLDRMYSEDSMKKFPYHLHAVLVHEGQAVSGHYWSFIYDEHRAKWLKFNDITVSESSLEEMRKESVGGFHNASAYCLMYVDRSKLEGSQGKIISSDANLEDSLAILPADLRAIVEEDNLAFQQELHAWDEDQRKKSLTATATSTVSASTMTTGTSPASTSSQWRGGARPVSEDQDVVVTGEQRPGDAVIIKPMNSSLARLADCHAQLSISQTLAAINFAIQSSHSPREVIKKAIENELVRLKAMSTTVMEQLPADDVRLHHIVLYLLCSHADEVTVQVIMSEQLAMCALMDTTKIKGLRHHAHEMYKTLYNSAGKEGIKHYEFWHKRYYHFRQSVDLFSAAVEAYCSSRYQEALPYFNQAWLHNCEPDIASNMLAEGAKINSVMLSYFRRKCLQHLNQSTLKSFESEDDITDALTVMMQQLLPSLSLLAQSDMKEDQAAVEDIREKWCHFLEKDLNAEKIERLQDFLSKMFDGNGASGQMILTNVKENRLGQVLCEYYHGAMKKLKALGELNTWVPSS